MRRIAISDELYATLQQINPDASKAIGLLIQSATFWGAAYISIKGIPVGFQELVQKIPPTHMEKFLILAEATLADLLRCESVEVKEEKDKI